MPLGRRFRTFRKGILRVSTRRSRASSRADMDDEAGEAGDELQFHDAALELRWSKEGLYQNIRFGAQLLAVLIMLFCARQVMVAIVSFTRIGSRTEDDGYLRRRVWIGVVDFVICILSCIFAWQCVKTPRVRIYFPLVIWFSVYLTAHGLWPFAQTCEETFQDLVDYKQPDVFLQVRNLDCTVHGHTVVQLVMTWVLVTPRLVPRAKLMYVNWIFIFGWYLGLTVWQRIRDPIGLDTFDIAVNLVLICLVNFVARIKKAYFEKSQRGKFQSDHNHKEASRKIFHILEYMVPEHVIKPMLQNPGELWAEQIDRVSILFIMIVDFEHHARQNTPEQLLAFLNCEFTRIDHICKKHKVTKIETVGEEYVCAVGVVPADRPQGRQEENWARSQHSRVLERLIRVAAEVLKPPPQEPHSIVGGDLAHTTSEEVRFKMGMHTGPVRAGVIGAKLPRFRLFGDTVNTSARMMQKCEPGKLQFGEETKKDLPDWVQTTGPREIEMKGKGIVVTYQMDGRAHHRGTAEHDLSDNPILTQRKTVLGEVLHLRHLAGPAEPLVDEPASDDEDEDDDEGYHSDEPQDLEVVPTPSTKFNLHKDDHFEKLMEEVFTEETESITSLSFWFSCGLKPRDFNSEMERAWLSWYHETTICKKLDARMDKQVIALLLLTTFEMLLATFVTKCFDEAKNLHGEDGLGELRLPFFLLLRGCVFALLVLWQAAAKRDKGKWIKQRPREIQAAILISYVIIATLMFFSYDMLSFVDVQVNLNMTKPEVDKVMTGHRRGTSTYSLVFVPVYLLLTAQHQLLFAHSLAFVVLTYILVFKVIDSVGGASFNLYYGQAGRILLLVGSIFNSSLAYSAESNSRSRFKTQQHVDASKKRIHQILSTLMPPLVLEEISGMGPNSQFPTHKYRRATIAQSDLVGFTKLASTRTPLEVVQFMGELFGKFDALTDDHNIYKVETVGDAYIAGQADIPLTTTHRPLDVLRFGLAMIGATQEWSTSKGFNVNCRVGIAHGECIGGIVGSGMQRYHLFGDLMSVLEVLESTAPEGRVQVNGRFKEEVDANLKREGGVGTVTFELRQGDHLTTSKGEAIDFEQAGGRTFLVATAILVR